MARLSRDARLETREARTRLKIQHEPYWRQIHHGLFIGYRKGKTGSKWIARRAVDGKYRKKTLGKADDRSDANGQDVLDYKQAHAKTLEFADSDLDITPIEYTVGDAMADYMHWHEAHGKSADHTRHVIDGHILPRFKNKLVADLNTSAISRWHQSLATAPLHRRGKKQAIDTADPDAVRKRKATANRILTVFKAALNHAWHEGKVKQKDVWGRVRPFRGVDTPGVRYLSEGECRRLLNACPPDFRQIVNAALLSGCRYGELCRLKVGDFNPGAGVIRISDSKSGKPRHVPLTDEGHTAFSRWVAGKLQGELIFARGEGGGWAKSHQSRRMRAACEIAKIDPPATFRDLRRTYGSLLAIKGVPLHVIAEVLGHADTRITKRHYAHLQPDYVKNTIRANLPVFGLRQDTVTPLREKA